MCKYDDDTTLMDAEIDELSIRLAKQKTLLENTTATVNILHINNNDKWVFIIFIFINQYEQRKEQIEAYLEYKEKKRLEAELLALQHRSATKIQAWWRGCMVRHCLGPYRKRRGKHKKDNKKNKKKKK